MKQPPAAAGHRLHWLPEATCWREDIRAVEAETNREAAWNKLVQLANTDLDFIKTNRLDRSLQRLFSDAPPKELATKPIRLAVAGTSTCTHLLPSLRIAALRRGLWIQVYEPEYGQYIQELGDPESALFAFRPDCMLFVFDAYHLTRGVDPAMDEAAAEGARAEILGHIKTTWRLARDAFQCPIIQQAALPLFPALMGNNEHRLPGSRRSTINWLNAALRPSADEAGVDLLTLDERVAVDGLSRWHDPVLWHRAKQEVSPAAAPFYGDLVGRIIAARQGRSSKCLVLDLDNTLWGGVIGDDGLDGIVLGQGSASGEAFVAFQTYAQEQAKRGIILAVCSKNDEANAFAPFDSHPEMILRRQDIAAFVANWSDKAQNLRAIAQQLNIGLDSLVFVDDNPFERNLVRAELPMVAVPELPDDPALFASCLSDAGYFEGLAITDEDRERTSQYQENHQRAALAAEATDLPSYLRGLDMRLVCKRFDRIGLQRIVQLINKTNQFNLTTRRYTEQDVLAVMGDPKSFGLQLRLLDRFGDNGIISIIVGRMNDERAVHLDVWLMSCRVLGRQVEEATLNLVAMESGRLGARCLVGEYILTAKNGMVREHYKKLRFAPLGDGGTDRTLWSLDLDRFIPHETAISVSESLIDA